MCIVARQWLGKDVFVAAKNFWRRLFCAVSVVPKKNRRSVLFLSKCSNGSQVPNCHCVFLMQSSRFQFTKIKFHCCESHQNYFFQIIRLDINLENPNPAALSQATAYNHLNAFTFTLALPDGRAGEASEPSDKIMLLLPPHNNVSLTFPIICSLYLLSYYTFYLSLSLLRTYCLFMYLLFPYIIPIFCLSSLFLCFLPCP
jgi:hypothetical protein